ncbi:hypothetical protein GIB67_034647 [Kingdonia uniflora]|uniref:NADH:ubiquinone reductase (non-electrogenic) n=1 Tax=Kingdonia uniflora TaxID=39325 RepID=A0A7J7P033_9MAGN|nr:hypothetical protein GIB67_034647 [Kingdonia uniflora]
MAEGLNATDPAQVLAQQVGGPSVNPRPLNTRTRLDQLEDKMQALSGIIDQVTTLEERLDGFSDDQAHVGERLVKLEGVVEGNMATLLDQVAELSSKQRVGSSNNYNKGKNGGYQARSGGDQGHGQNRSGGASAGGASSSNSGREYHRPHNNGGASSSASGGLVAYSESQADHSALAANLSPRDVKKKRVIVPGTCWACMSFPKNIDNFSFDVQVVSPRNYFSFTPLLPSVTCECVKIDATNKKVIYHSNDDTVLGKTEILLDYDYLKFQRDGIEVKIGCRVIGASEKEIVVKVKSEGIVSSVPYGMVVWSAGTGTRPVIRNFMEQIGQSKRGSLDTDEWQRVEGCDSVYALGGCATIHQRKFMEDISMIFSAADKDNSGTITVKEFQDVIKDILVSLVRYSQLELYLKNKHLRSAKDLLKDSQGNDMKEVNIEGFKSALSHVDSQLKGLPATAQVAAQQGTYLARSFNHMEEYKTSPEGPLRFKESSRHQFCHFRYKHFGQFALLGGEQTAAKLLGDWVSTGHSSQWLWYSVNASKQVSWCTRVLVVSDWTRRFIFGRDSSGI